MIRLLPRSTYHSILSRSVNPLVSSLVSPPLLPSSAPSLLFLSSPSLSSLPSPFLSLSLSSLAPLCLSLPSPPSSPHYILSFPSLLHARVPPRVTRPTNPCPLTLPLLSSSSSLPLLESLSSNPSPLHLSSLLPLLLVDLPSSLLSALAPLLSPSSVSSLKSHLHSLLCLRFPLNVVLSSLRSSPLSLLTFPLDSSASPSLSTSPSPSLRSLPSSPSSYCLPGLTSPSPSSSFLSHSLFPLPLVSPVFTPPLYSPSIHYSSLANRPQASRSPSIVTLPSALCLLVLYVPVPSRALHPSLPSPFGSLSLFLFSLPSPPCTPLSFSSPLLLSSTHPHLSSLLSLPRPPSHPFSFIPSSSVPPPSFSILSPYSQILISPRYFPLSPSSFATSPQNTLSYSYSSSILSPHTSGSAISPLIFGTSLLRSSSGLASCPLVKTAIIPSPFFPSFPSSPSSSFPFISLSPPLFPPLSSSHTPLFSLFPSFPSSSLLAVLSLIAPSLLLSSSSSPSPPLSFFPSSPPLPSTLTHLILLSSLRYSILPWLPPLLSSLLSLLSHFASSSLHDSI
ncbi:hypothetical protein C7M84_017535 [Penaeus vannamei]|uniref:Uncharacterized protein n=1 Tax=Penaeus vannamei TaxID=6689 RepID=A0A3R7NR62_PENVA|nr:hypothetical protein C7M84_017535 [Penaeus vannamei]